METTPQHLDVPHNEETVIGSKFTADDINLEAPSLGGTKIIIQRHEEYIRDQNDERVGSLTVESAKRSYDQSKKMLEEIMASIPKNEQKDMSILVVGSNTKHFDKGMRSMETANEVLKAVNAVIDENELDRDQVLNTKSKKKQVPPIKKIQQPYFFDDSPEFLEFLMDKYGGLNQAFWAAFEEDAHKETREKLGAEGPEDIIDRFELYLQILNNFSKFFHKKNPRQRLIIWVVSHYDTISPYIKNRVTKTDPKEYVPVNYGAGISIDIDEQGQASSTFKGAKHTINLTK